MTLRPPVRPTRPVVPPPVAQWFLGVDVGKLQDPAALSVCLRVGAPPALYQVRYLQRWKLGTRYGDVCDRVAEVWRSPLLKGHKYLVIDATGGGGPVLEMFEERGLPPVGITITKSGSDVVRIPKTPTLTRRPGEPLCVAFFDYHVSKRDLTSMLRKTLEGGRIKVAADIAERDVLQQELLNFSRKISDSGNEMYEAYHANEHDDVALSVALPIWYAEHEVPAVHQDAPSQPLKVRLPRELRA